MRIVPDSSAPAPPPQVEQAQMARPQHQPIDPTAVLPGGNPFAQDAETLAYQRLHAAILQMDLETDRIQSDADMKTFADRHGVDQDVIVHFASERMQVFLAKFAAPDGKLQITQEVLGSLMGAMWLDGYTSAAVERPLTP